MVTIVNYGMGNLRSIESALHHLRFACVIEERPDRVAASDMLILPGVGSFARAMANLRSTGLRDALEHAVRGRGVPVLGICLGMQLLATRGTEDGLSEGLGWIPGEVVRFTAGSDRKVPHIGFNTVSRKPQGAAMFSGLPHAADFYFVHSFHLVPLAADTVTGECEYGEAVVAAVANDNVWGVQFHPEKSQGNGLQLLRNFCGGGAGPC
jgi:imidazole glycerol-phosphate synthase subunit HisH